MFKETHKQFLVTKNVHTWAALSNFENLAIKTEEFINRQPDCAHIRGDIRGSHQAGLILVLDLTLHKYSIIILSHSYYIPPHGTTIKYVK